MISIGLEEQIRQLLGEGRLSQRKIAKQTGVSRATVGAIASGKRTPFLAQRLADDQPYFSQAKPPQRCPECGARVYMPCHVCFVRRLMATHGARLPGPVVEESADDEILEDYAAAI
jgi:hypothetical protein